MKFKSVSPLAVVPFALLFLAGCGGNSSGGSNIPAQSEHLNWMKVNPDTGLK